MVAIATSLIFLAVFASSVTAAPVKVRASDAIVDVDILSEDPSKARVIDANVNSATHSPTDKRTVYYYKDADTGSLVDIDIASGSYDYDETYDHGRILDAEILRRTHSNEAREIMKRSLLDLDIGGYDDTYAVSASAPQAAAPSATSTPTSEAPVFTAGSNVIHFAHHGGSNVKADTAKKVKTNKTSKASSIKASIKTKHRPIHPNAKTEPAKVSIKTKPSAPTHTATIQSTPIAPASPSTTTIYTETDHGSLLDLDILKRDAE